MSHRIKSLVLHVALKTFIYSAGPSEAKERYSMTFLSKFFLPDHKRYVR